MSQPLGPNTYPPEIKGYRIRQYINTEPDPQPNQQTLLKILVKNQSNGIPKIRNDVICNGKHYPFVPLFTFTSEDDLKVIEQISTIVLRDENQVLCEILSGKVKEVRSSQFKDLKARFKAIFSLDLKIDPEELFLVIISDQIVKQTQFNDILDSISETEFVNLLKKIFENCPNRVIPKILRKISKYFNSTKGRTPNSIERLKKVLKIIKSADENPQPQEKQQSQIKPMSKSQNDLQEEEWIVVPKNTKKTSTKKQTIVVSQKITEIEQKPAKKPQVTPSPKKQETEKSIPTNESQTVTKKIKQTQKVKKTEKVSKKQKITQAENVTKVKKEQTPKKATQNQSINEQNWQDIDSSDEQKEQVITKGKLEKKSFNADSSDQDLKYQVYKKSKGKKGKNANIYVEPQVSTDFGKKPPHLKKQKKNAPAPNNLTNQGKPRKPQPQQEEEQQFDRRNYGGKQQFNNNNHNNKNKNRQNGRNNTGEQSVEKGRRQFSSQNRKMDSRILLGINGASDSVWREKMRPPRYINKENNSYDRNRGQSLKENNPSSKQQRIKPSVSKQQSTKTQPQKSQSTSQQPANKNLSLQKVFSFPEDTKQGKNFKFQQRNYNLFVNKLFWVNISGDQVTVQKQGKGYIRKCKVEIINNGKGITTDGLTIDMDGLSNLQDGGTAFGSPVFQEFTPDGQWFNISSLDVFSYV